MSLERRVRMITVAIIDDNKPLADRIANTIPWKDMGCTVVLVAYDGLVGKKGIVQYQPDLIVVDVRMPNMSGLETIELTRSFIPDSKVIFISAYDEFEYAYKAIKLKAFDYLIKPFTQADLLKTVEKAVAELKGYASSAEPKQAESSEHSGVVSRVLEYMDKHIGEKFTLDDLAGLFSLSPNHLGRLIKQETGKRFIELATELRIEKAKVLLTESDFKVGEIGEMVGYKNYLTFYKVFCRIEGIPPTEYTRQRSRKNMV